MGRRYITKKIREKVYNKYKGRCAYCGRDIEKLYFHVDHIKPVHIGGTNDYDNLNPSCIKCNKFKSGMPLDEYRRVWAFSRTDTPYFSKASIQWLKEHIAILGDKVESNSVHIFPFEEWEGDK